MKPFQLFRRALLFALGLLLLNAGSAQTNLLPSYTNIHAAVTNIDRCGGKVTVQSTAGFAAGNKILIIKMRGAQVNLGANDPNYGNITYHNGVGTCEYAHIKSISGTTITLEKAIINYYGPGYLGDVQIVKVLEAQHFRAANNVSASAWDGLKGGVLVINCCTLTLNNDRVITMSGRGFRGGKPYVSPDIFNNGAQVWSSLGIFYNFESEHAGNKGEGVASGFFWGTSGDAHGAGYGHFANGGGGGNNHNAGGGGGGNAGAGGQGGDIFSHVPGGTPFPNRAQGGVALSQHGLRVFMGGGGGSGHDNQGLGTNGQNGGGIIIIHCDQLINNGGRITVSGETPSSTASDDGAGGGGAAGTIVLYCGAYSGSSSTLTSTVNGGKGGSVSHTTFSFGPGGGGSDGVIYRNPGMATIINAGSVANKAGNDSRTGTTYGAANGGARAIRDYIDIPEGNIAIDTATNPPGGYDQVFNICPGQDVTICDSVLLDALKATWYGYGTTRTEYIDPNAAPILPSCNRVPVPDTKKQICQTYRNVQYSSDVNLSIDMENGCSVGRRYRVNVAPYTVIDTVVTITCGNTVNLNQFNGCVTQISYGWKDSTHGINNVQSPVKPKETTVYKKEYFVYNDGDQLCKVCEIRLTVKVVQPVVQDTINTCEGYGHVLNAGSFFPGQNFWFWTLPDGSHPIGNFSPALNITAHNGDVYTAISLMPGGCLATVRFTIRTVVPVTYNNTLNIYCGDSINLDMFDRCSGFGYNWFNVTSGTFMANGKVAPAYTTTYRRSHYADITLQNCLSCIADITVNVLPRPLKRLTLYACENDSLVIGGLVNIACGNGYVYHWFGPENVSLPYTTSSVKVKAHHNDVYRLEMGLVNGCQCTTEITIETYPVLTQNRDITLYCGDSLNLDTISGCEGFHGVWQKSGVTISSSRIAPGDSGTYIRNTYSDSTQGCLICVLTVNITVLPRPVAETDTAGCPGQTLGLQFPCGGNGTQYHLITPHESFVYYPPATTAWVTVQDTPVVYTLETVMPNGCLCTRKVTVLMIEPDTARRVLNVHCGDSLNLDTINLCDEAEHTWKDEAGNVTNPRIRLTGQNVTRKYYRYSINSAGCIACITELTVNVLPLEDKTKTFNIGCNVEGKYIYPDCQGAVYEWYNQSGHFTTVTGGNGQILVVKSADIQQFTVKTVTEAGCICITHITVTAAVPVPSYADHNITVDCGNTFDLASMDDCAGITGTTSGWKDFTLNQQLDSTAQTATPANHNHLYVKEVYDESGCLKCRVTVRLTVKQNFSYIDHPEIFRVCNGTQVNPAPQCPGADHYQWYDDNGVNLLSTQPYIVAQTSMAGLFLRVNYDVHNCVICVERIEIQTYTPVTQQDIDQMTPVEGVIDCPDEFCEDVTLFTRPVSFGPGISCIWEPSSIPVSQTSQGILLCPPFVDGQVLVRKCYGDDGCLINAYKVQINLTDCEEMQARLKPAQDLAGQARFMLYPNPTESSFTVERDRAEGEIAVQVINTMGQLVKDARMKDGQSQASLDMSDHARGVYLVKMVAASGQVSVQRLILR